MYLIKKQLLTDLKYNNIYIISSILQPSSCLDFVEPIVW